MTPPAWPIALATCPSMPGWSSISTRIVRLYWALGVALTRACSWLVRPDRDGRGVILGGRAPRVGGAPRTAAAASAAHYCGPVATDTTAGARQRDRRRRRRAETLFLIDGNSLVYRAFFALPESIATSTGVPTNAIFGFASMLVKIVTEYGTSPTIVVWDAGSSGRREMYAEYKAQRESRPDLLKAQWPAMEPLVEAFGYRNVKVEGYEADDVIASLAERAPSRRRPGDDRHRRPRRLPADRRAGLVRVMATARGITETKIYDRQAVIDRYGIPPELIPDFYGLKGDTSDNIPGVPGIGDKTASELHPALRLARGGARRTSTTSAAPSASRTSSSTPRTRASVQAAGHDAARRAGRLRPARRGRRASPTARGCARCSASTSCATRCAGWRRRSAAPTRRRRRRPAEVRARRARARGRARRRRRAGRRGAGGRRRARRRGARRARCSPRARRGGSRSRGPPPAPRSPAATCSPATAVPEEVALAAGERAVIAHDAKALGVVPPGLRARHAARRLPARAGAPRLPVRRAVRGARARRRASTIRWRPTRCSWARSPPRSAPRSRSAGCRR